MKNIVLCCDGTGNEFGDANSNVVKLYQALHCTAGEQVAYYHPGVGTMGDMRALSALGKAWTKTCGLAFGYGFSDNIADAYRFLMQEYEPGDQVFLFGFSRGAYTARALCGMLKMLGLLSRGNEALIPYAMRLYKRKDGWLSRFKGALSKFGVAGKFQEAFARPCDLRFLGLWDTVSSVGWLIDPFSVGTVLPYTYKLPNVQTIRHAVSIDERRAFFPHYAISCDAGPDRQEMWFAGVHSDVGGSYPEAESGLAKISLEWMFREAEAAGLHVDAAKRDKLLGRTLAYARPVPTAMLHKSLTLGWWLAEFWPKRKLAFEMKKGERTMVRRFHVNLFRRRPMPPAACVDASVPLRRALLTAYQPANVPAGCVVGTSVNTVAYPVRLEVGYSFGLSVFARLKWNDTAVEMKSGERYRLEGSGDWYDASVTAGPEGYKSPSWLFRMLERWRRSPKDDWFALMGGVSGDASTVFRIGAAVEYAARSDGMLTCFANDLPWMLFNNNGSVKLKVTRLA